jgi:PAS domain S-box-containing protein
MPKDTHIAGDSSAMFHAVLETVGEGIITIDSSSKIVVVNQEVQNIWGYTQNEIIGKRIELLMPEKYRERHATGLKRYVETGVPHVMGARLELEGLKKDGTVFPLEIRMSETRFGDRRLFTAAVRDLTDRKTVQAAIEQRHRIEDLIASISTKFINLPSNDIDEGIVDALRTIGQATGIDRPWVALLSEDKKTLHFTHEWCAHRVVLRRSSLGPMSVDSIPWAMEQFRRRETVYIPRVADLPPEARVEKESLQAFDVQSVIMVPIVYGGSLMGIVSFDSVGTEKTWTKDDMALLRITGEIFANALERQQAYNELEQKVEERTRALRQKQAQLIQAEKMAALGQLVAGVAHEINTPLGALKSNIDILTRSFPKIKNLMLDPKIPQQFLESSDVSNRLASLEILNTHNQTAIDRIVMIVSSLRKFARLDEAELDEVDIHEGLDSTLILVQHQLKNRVDVRKNYGKLPLIKCYPNQLNQVFMNLLVNASHAIEGQGNIFIHTYHKADTAVVEIRDTGKGISQKDLPRIFDPGFTTKGFGVGTGLGLSIVYQIMKDHKGKVEVESELGQGTTFRIILPIS